MLRLTDRLKSSKFGPLAIGTGLLLLSSETSWSKLSAPEFRVHSELQKGDSQLELKITPPPGHHINLQAPYELKQGTQLIKPLEATASQLNYQIKLPAAEPISLSIYLCDDKNTFCEKHHAEGKWQSNAKSYAFTFTGESGAGDLAQTPSNTSDNISANIYKDENGFIINDAPQAFARAKAEGKPLLIDFFGIWCPPCNELEEDVFTSKDFQSKAKGFVKLKLDSDLKSSWDLKSKYKIPGYPTVIFSNSEGEEINRIVGFRPKKDFLEILAQAWDGKAETFAVLKAKAEKGDRQAADRLGVISLDQKKYGEAIQFLTGTEKKKEALSEAKTGLLAQKKKDALWASEIESSLKLFPQTANSLERRQQLADYYESQKQPERQKKLQTEIVEVSRFLLAHPEKLKGFDYAPADLWQLLGETYENLGKAPEAKQAWASAVAEYRKKKPSDHERGYNLEMGFCLWKAGKWDEAQALYEKLETAYPNEFTFYFSHARMDAERKKTESAKDLGLKALSHSYGDNRLKVTKFLAKLYQAQGQKAEGLALVKKTLADFQAPVDPELGTSRLMSSLRDLEKQLAL